MTLFSGTALAQIVPLIVTPVVTRIYTPSDYGVLAVFVTCSSLCAVAATLRYDLAILLPADERDAMALTILCGLCVLCGAAVVFLFILICHNSLLQVLRTSAVAMWMYLVPVSVVFVGWSSGLNYWLNRQKQDPRIAISRVTVALIGATASVAFGVTGFGSAGLILAVVIGQFAALCMLLGWARREVCGGLRGIDGADLRRVAVSHAKFPMLSLPSDGINALSQQLPVLMLSQFFGSAVAGHFAFSQRILGMPLNLMSQSISDVFRQRASADYSKHGNCRSIFTKTSRMLGALSIVLLVIIFLFAPAIFREVFGAPWEEAGRYTRYLAPLYMFRFIVSPLSYVFYIANRQGADLVGQVALLAVSVGSMSLGAYLKSGDGALITFSGGYLLVYCFYFWGARQLAQGKAFVIFGGAT